VLAVTLQPATAGEPIDRAFARLAVHTLIGDFAQPLPHLPVHVVQIGELAQRPEVLAQVTDGAFDFSFLPSAGRIAGVRIEVVVFAGEAREARMEADDPAIMFSYGGGEIVVSDLTRLCEGPDYAQERHSEAYNRPRRA
jgi:hypothetical protein